MGNSAKKSDNFYIHYLSEFIPVKDKKIDFKMNVKNADPFTIFYKCAPNQNELKKAKWSIDQYSTNNTFTAEKCDSLCQFLIVFKNQEKFRNKRFEIYRNAINLTDKFRFKLTTGVAVFRTD